MAKKKTRDKATKNVGRKKVTKTASERRHRDARTTRSVRGPTPATGLCIQELLLRSSRRPISTSPFSPALASRSRSSAAMGRGLELLGPAHTEAAQPAERPVEPGLAERAAAQPCGGRARRRATAGVPHPAPSCAIQTGAVTG